MSAQEGYLHELNNQDISEVTRMKKILTVFCTTIILIAFISGCSSCGSGTKPAQIQEKTDIATDSAFESVPDDRKATEATDGPETVLTVEENAVGTTENTADAAVSVSTVDETTKQTERKTESTKTKASSTATKTARTTTASKQPGTTSSAKPSTSASSTAGTSASSTTSTSAKTTTTSSKPTTTTTTTKAPAPEPDKKWADQDSMNSVVASLASYAQSIGMTFDTTLNESNCGYWSTATQLGTAPYSTKQEYINALREVISFERSVDGYEYVNVKYYRSGDDYISTIYFG